MRSFIQHVHYLRGLAILFVIGVHARGGVADWSSNPDTLRFLVTVFDAEEGNGTIMFLFIGGFLFQYLNRDHFDYRKYLQTKFNYIILPYIIISVPIILFRIKSNYYQPGLPDDFLSYNALMQFVYYLFVGSHMAPFWFISAIILYYLTAPVFHYLDKPAFYRYVYPVILVLSMFTYRPDHNANPFLAYIHLLPVYFSGMFVSRYHEQFFAAAKRLLVPAVLCYLAISYMDVRGWLIPDITFEQVLTEGVIVFNFYFLRAMLLCMICVTLFYIYRDKRLPLFDLLGHYSFGIFFIHFIVIAMTRNVLSVMRVDVDFTLITFLLYFSCMTLLSTAAVYFIKRLTGSYSKILIGS